MTDMAKFMAVEAEEEEEDEEDDPTYEPLSMDEESAQTREMVSRPASGYRVRVQGMTWGHRALGANRQHALCRCSPAHQPLPMEQDICLRQKNLRDSNTRHCLYQTIVGNPGSWDQGHRGRTA